MSHSTPVTIQVVAAQAGVSIATVSRVLADKPGAGKEVRERVLRVAEELNYRGNSFARSLRLKKSNTMGLLVPSIVNPFFPALIQEIEQRLNARGHGLLLADSQGSIDIERQRVRSLVDRQIDALIVSPVDELRSRPTLEAAAERIPVIQVDRRATSRAPYVGVDHHQAMDLVVSHLSNAGRRRFGFVGYAPGVSTSEARIAAFRELVRERGAAPEPPVFRETGEHSMPDRFAWLDEHAAHLDAIVTTSDLIAVTIQDALRQRDYAVPEDIAIVSFDDTPLASAAQLTSVRQPLEEMAAATVALAGAAEETAMPPEGFVSTLTVRASSGGIGARR